MGPIRTAIVHNIVTPYRNVLFNSISQHPDIDLHVFYCAKSHEKRNWTVDNKLGHDHTFLSGLAFDRSERHFHANPKIIHELISNDFDAIVFGGCTNLTMQLGYVTSKLSHTGTVLWTERIQPPRGVIGQLVDPIVRKVASHADSLVVPTMAARRFQETRGIECEKLFISPNVIDNDQYDTENDTDGSLRLLFVGQLIERKGISYLLDAYEALEDADVELVIVGDGPMRNDYERQAQRRDLDVTFAGWVTEKQKREAFANADLFVLPSLEDLAPLVLNEALASGLPVLTTEGVGNASDMIIEGGNGYIVPTADAGELAKRLTDLLSDYSELKRMGKRSLRISDERFSPVAAADQFANAIKTAVAH